MNAADRANAIIQDILTNRLPRIREGLEKGYVDENQILIVYDHAVRARVLKEYDFEIDAAKISAGIVSTDEHEDALSRINAELEAEEKPVIVGTEFSPVETKLVNVPAPGVPCGVLKEVPTSGYEVTPTARKMLQEAVERLDADEGEKAMAIIIARNELHDVVYYVDGIKEDGYPEFTHKKDKAKLHPVNAAHELAKQWTAKYADMTFTAEPVSNLDWKPHVEKHACVCGGVIHDLPTGVETMLKCKQCGRTFLDEFELAEARRTQTKTGEKCADATYWTTGTLAGGTNPVPMETEINVNGRKWPVKARNGKFILRYEEIVSIALNQKDISLRQFAVGDAELPNYSCTYRHRTSWEKLHGERSGTLTKGQSVECTPGMSITCIDTSGA